MSAPTPHVAAPAARALRRARRGAAALLALLALGTPPAVLGGCEHDIAAVLALRSTSADDPLRVGAAFCNTRCERCQECAPAMNGCLDELDLALTDARTRLALRSAVDRQFSVKLTELERDCPFIVRIDVDPGDELPVEIDVDLDCRLQKIAATVRNGAKTRVEADRCVSK